MVSKFNWARHHMRRQWDSRGVNHIFHRIWSPVHRVWGRYWRHSNNLQRNWLRRRRRRSNFMKNFRNGRKIRVRTWRNNYVQMHGNGRHVKQGGAGAWEIFYIKRLPRFGYNCIALFGRHKRYLRAHGNKRTIDQSGRRPHYNSYPMGWAWERFWVEHLGRGKFGFRTLHNTYLRAHSNGWMDQSGHVPRGRKMPHNWRWERFSIQWLGGRRRGNFMRYWRNGRRLRLRTWRGNYVQMHGNGRHVKQGGAGTWEIFYIKRLPRYGHNCIALFGRHKRYLRARNNRRTIDQSGRRPHWNSFPMGWQWERFWVEPVGRGEYALRTRHNTYLRAHSNGWMDQSGYVRRGRRLPRNWRWERFRPQWI